MLRIVAAWSGSRVARPRLWITLFAVAVAIVLCTVMGAGPARAAGATSCGKPWTNQVGTVYTCDLWPPSSIPVFAQPNGGSRVGMLNKGGWANWFTSQTEGATYTAHGYQNNWWARTLADNGQWGYVSEVYFAQGANFERDASLPIVGQASQPAPQGPPGSLGTPGAGEPNQSKPPTADRCGPREPVRLRVTVATPDLPGTDDPAAGSGEGRSVGGNVSHQVHTDAISGAHKGASLPGTEQIGTVQNCVHRTGDKLYGRTFLRLKKQWNISAHYPLIIKTSLHVHGGHSPGPGSLSVLDRPGQNRPGRNRYGDPHAWYLTRAFGRTKTGHADDGRKADRPANGTFVWDTRPTTFSAAATYEVDTRPVISSADAFVNNGARPAGVIYAGWSPAQGKNREQAMLDLTMSWHSGLLRF